MMMLYLMMFLKADGFSYIDNKLLSGVKETKYAFHCA